jgi:hypothetical protein
MKIFMIAAAVLLVCYGIYKLYSGNKTEGALEISGGILEIIFEILAVF